MKFILADTEIEYIPQVILNDREFKREFRPKGYPGEALLNYPVHRKFIERYFPEKASRMGRLHIPYFFTRMTEESIINNFYEVDYAIHTKDGYIIEKSELKDIQSYEEFIGEVDRLLSLKSKINNLNEYLEKLGYDSIYVLHPSGNKSMDVKADSIFIIGGFAEGDFTSDLSRFEKLKVFEKEITVPSALEILHFSIISSVGYPYIHFSSL